MDHTQILALIDNVLPDIKSTGHPESVLLKYAQANNLSPAQLARAGQTYNTMMALTTQTKAANRGDAFYLLDVPHMLDEFTKYTPPKEASAGMQKSAASAIIPGGPIPSRYELQMAATHKEAAAIVEPSLTESAQYDEARKVASTIFETIEETKERTVEYMTELGEALRKSCSGFFAKIAKVADLSDAWPEVRAEIVAGVPEGDTVIENLKAYCKQAGMVVPEDGNHTVGVLLRDRYDVIGTANDIAEYAFQMKVAEEFAKSAFVRDMPFVRALTRSIERSGDPEPVQKKQEPTQASEVELTDEELHRMANESEERDAARKREKEEEAAAEAARLEEAAEETTTPEESPEVTPEEASEPEADGGGGGGPTKPGAPSAGDVLPNFPGSGSSEHTQKSPGVVSSELQGLLDGLGAPIFKTPGSIGAPLDILRKTLDATRGSAQQKQKTYDSGMHMAKAEAALQKAILGTPTLADADPDEVNNAFRAIYRLNPAYAEDASMLAPVLQETIQYGAVPMHIAGELSSQNKTRIDAEKSQAQLDAMRYS